MQILLIALIVLGGMGLSVEAGILGPLGQQVGDFWATFSIFSIGTILSLLLILFFGPRKPVSYFSRPSWELMGGLLGPCYVVILTIVTPIIGIALTMIGILTGQVTKSLIIDHYGLLGMPKRRIDKYRIMALILIIVALTSVSGVIK